MKDFFDKFAEAILPIYVIALAILLMLLLTSCTTNNYYPLAESHQHFEGDHRHPVEPDYYEPTDSEKFFPDKRIWIDGTEFTEASITIEIDGDCKEDDEPWVCEVDNSNEI